MRGWDGLIMQLPRRRCIPHRSSLVIPHLPPPTHIPHLMVLTASLRCPSWNWVRARLAEVKEKPGASSDARRK